MDTSTTKNKNDSITLDSSSKNTVRIILNIIIIVILMILIIYAVVGTYIFYNKYVKDGVAPVSAAVSEAASMGATSVSESAAASATEAAAEVKKLFGGFINNIKF
jgi:hypothetical protein